MARGLSRRELLLRAGALGAVAAAGGAGLAVGRGTAEASPTAKPADAVPFHGRHQAGILTPQQEHLHFAVFDLEGEGRKQLRDLMREWTLAAEGLTTATPVRAPGTSGNALSPPGDTGESEGLGPARLTLTFGFGPGALARAGLAARRPEALIDLPHFFFDDLDPERSGGDLCVQACSDQQQVAFHAIRNLTRIARGAANPRWAQNGFHGGRPDGGTPRNLMGFKDGTNNLDPTDAEVMGRQVWVNASEGPDWMADGSYLVARRIMIRVELWDRTGLAEQEQIMGRRRASGAPLGGLEEHDPVIPERLPRDAHVLLANPRKPGSELERFLRRGYNFGSAVDGLGQLEAGLFFLAYQRDPRKQFVPVQHRLAASDILNEYTLHTGSAIFAVPRGISPGGYVGETLLG
jgi:deferrochelatase/peroxidase EfeB